MVNKHLRLSLLVLIAIFGALVLCFPGIYGTQTTFVDIRNGLIETRSESLGRVYHREVRDTQFSKLVERLGMQTSSVWERASTEQQGVRRWLFPQNVSYTGGKTAAAMVEFAQLVELGDVNDVTNQVIQLRDLAASRDGTAVKNFVHSLSQGTNSPTSP